MRGDGRGRPRGSPTEAGRFESLGPRSPPAWPRRRLCVGCGRGPPQRGRDYCSLCLHRVRDGTDLEEDLYLTEEESRRAVAPPGTDWLAR